MAFSVMDRQHGTGRARSRSETAMNRDFPNTRDRLRRLDSVDSDARLTLVQRSAPVESTLKQDSPASGLPQKRAASCATRERGNVGPIRGPIADRLMLTLPVVHGDVRLI